MSSFSDAVEGGKAVGAITIIQLIVFSATLALVGTLMAAGNDKAIDATRYVTFGIASLTVTSILSEFIKK